MTWLGRSTCKPKQLLLLWLFGKHQLRRRGSKQMVQTYSAMQMLLQRQQRFPLSVKPGHQQPKGYCHCLALGIAVPITNHAHNHLKTLSNRPADMLQECMHGKVA